MILEGYFARIWLKSPRSGRYNLVEKPEPRVNTEIGGGHIKTENLFIRTVYVGSVVKN